MRLYLATREAAHHRLYAGTPWLRDRVLALITDYAKAISVDFSAVEQLASSIDPSRPGEHRGRAGPGDVRADHHPGPAGRDGRAGDAARAGRGLGGHGRRRSGRRPAARCGGAARDPASPPGDRWPRRADLRHPDRPGAAAAPAACRSGPVAGDRRRPRHRRPGRALGAPRPAADRAKTWTIPAGFVDRDKQFTELLAGLDDIESHLQDEAEGSDTTASGTATDSAPTDKARPTAPTDKAAEPTRQLPTTRDPAPTRSAARTPRRLTQTRPSQTELDGLHRLIPESTACRSIRVSSSSSKSRLPIVARLSSSCSHRRRTDQHRGHPRVPQGPGQCQLRQGLAATGGDVVQRPDVGERLVGEQVGGQRTAPRRPGVGRDAVQVAVGQHALGQRRERDAADPQLRRGCPAARPPPSG